jgi:hypothetical protein
MLMKKIEPQLVWPPVTVRGADVTERNFVSVVMVMIPDEEMCVPPYALEA